jgi:quinol monooxygenase YgiN
MSVIVIATVVPKAEHRGEVIAAFEAAVARVHAEDPGCEMYALHEAPDELVMIEKWTDRDALDAHGSAEAVTELNRAVAGKLQLPVTVATYTPRPAGTTTQGQL